MIRVNLVEVNTFITLTPLKYNGIIIYLTTTNYVSLYIVWI